MRRGLFDVKIDYDDENIIKKRFDKIEEVKRLVDRLVPKFR